MMRQVRCGVGLTATIISVILILAALTPPLDAVSCKCKEEDDALDPPQYMCSSVSASLSDLAKQGDSVILFVYWLLVITVAVLLLRIAGIITFFHTEEADYFFNVDAVVNVMTCIMMLLAFFVTINWARVDDRCDAIEFQNNPFSCLSLLAASAICSATMAVADGIIFLERANMYNLVPTTQREFAVTAPPPRIYATSEEEEEENVEHRNATTSVELKVSNTNTHSVENASISVPAATCPSCQRVPNGDGGGESSGANL